MKHRIKENKINFITLMFKSKYLLYRFRPFEHHHAIKYLQKHILPFQY